MFMTREDDYSETNDEFVLNSVSRIFRSNYIHILKRKNANNHTLYICLYCLFMSLVLLVWPELLVQFKILSLLNV